MQTEVLMYTIPNCRYCAAAKDYLNTKGIAFREIDVLANNKAFAREMIEKSGQKTVPVVDWKGTIVVGFKPEEYDALMSAS